MYAAIVGVSPPPDVTPEAKEQFRSTLQNQAQLHPIEHLHMRDGPEQLEITLFLRAGSQSEANLLGYHICAQTVHRFPGWRLDT